MALISDDDLPQKVVALLEADELEVMLDGLNAKASRVAPCLTWTGAADSATPAPTQDQLAEAKLILVGVTKRWAEAGSGAFSQKTVITGPYSETETTDTRNKTGYNLWPSEIAELQELCARGASASAFTVDTAPSLCGQHLLWCSLNFGATYCSCGVDIAWQPIFELG